MSKKIPESELQDWLNYLEKPDNNPTSKDESNVIDKLIIDLHFHNLNQAVSIMEKNLNFAYTQKISNIELITGIGKNEHSQYGVLYIEIPRIIESNKVKYKISSFERDHKNPGMINIKLKI